MSSTVNRETHVHYLQAANYAIKDNRKAFRKVCWLGMLEKANATL